MEIKNMSCQYTSSEMKDKFKVPKLKKPTVTRARIFEKFLWQELYDEYLRHNERLMNPVITKSNSEYYDEFCKHIPTRDDDVKEALINQYPLYSTSAITLWNHTGEMNNFKKRYSITRPVYEQSEQFG